MDQDRDQSGLEDAPPPAVPPRIVLLFMRIDWLTRWIFDFSGRSTWVFLSLCIATVLVALYSFRPAALGEDPHWIAKAAQHYYDGFGNVTDPLEDPNRHGFFMGRTGGRDPVESVQDALALSVLLLPAWIGFRLALLPLYFLGRRIKRSISL